MPSANPIAGPSSFIVFPPESDTGIAPPAPSGQANQGLLQPKPSPSRLDRRLLTWANHLFGARRRGPTQIRTDNVLWSLTHPCPSRANVEKHHRGQQHLPRLTAKDVAAHNNGEWTAHLIPRMTRIDDEPHLIPVRFDVDAHDEQQDAQALAEWINSNYLNGRGLIMPSDQGASVYVCISLNKQKITDFDTGEVIREWWPAQLRINSWLIEAHRCIAKLAEQAGFASKVELKGRLHVTRRWDVQNNRWAIHTTDDDHDYAQALAAAADHNPVHLRRDYPIRIQCWGEPIKLPRITTTEQMDRLEQAVVEESSIWSILKDAESDIKQWSDCRKETDAERSRRLAKNINQCSSDEAIEAVGEAGSTLTSDHHKLLNPDIPNEYRYAAAARIALRQAKGDFEKALPLALELVAEQNGGPATGPTTAKRVARLRSKIRYAGRTFNHDKVGNGGGGPGWFDVGMDPFDMVRRQTGMVSQAMIDQANAEHPAARLSRLKLAQITLLIQKSIATGNITHVNSAGLRQFAQHAKVGFSGINGSAIAAVKTILIKTGQAIRLHGHNTKAKLCEKWCLGVNAVVQKWLEPLLVEGKTHQVSPGPQTAMREHQNHPPHTLSQVRRGLQLNISSPLTVVCGAHQPQLAMSGWQCENYNMSKSYINHSCGADWQAKAG